jgi:hypothetical protein
MLRIIIKQLLEGDSSENPPEVLPLKFELKLKLELST